MRLRIVHRGSYSRIMGILHLRSNCSNTSDPGFKSAAYSNEFRAEFGEVSQRVVSEVTHTTFVDLQDSIEELTNSGDMKQQWKMRTGPSEASTPIATSSRKEEDGKMTVAVIQG